MRERREGRGRVGQGCGNRRRETVDQTPGPFVYLNTTNNPNSGMPLRVGALKNRSGAQTCSFQVPPGGKYTHVLIWCDPFNVAMVDAVIPPTGG